MPRRPRRVSGSGIYHVMLRGVNRDPIFLDDEDRVRFLVALRTAKQVSACRVLAYCLMDNHVHLVLRTGTEPLGVVVKRLGVRYAAWFNRRYERVGHLFQDRFKSVAVETDPHLVSLLRYVWNNPVKAGLVEHPDEYRWSSRWRFGRPSLLVDADELDSLLTSDPLADDAGPDVPLWEGPRKRGRRPRYSEEQAAALLEQACGADGPEQFLKLAEGVQREAIRELRARSISFNQLAAVTGLSSTTLKRRHATRSAAD